MSVDRRTVLKWVGVAAGVAGLGVAVRLRGGGAGVDPAHLGYGVDPDLIDPPTDLWPSVLDDHERELVTALCDLILPADGDAAGAVGVGVPAFVEEWVSAPYPQMVGDKAVVRGVLAWFDAEARRRHGKGFVELDEAQRAGIADGVVDVGRAADADAAHGFRRLRELVAGGWATTPVGLAAVGYVGNVPKTAWTGPSDEVLALLGIDG